MKSNNHPAMRAIDEQGRRRGRMEGREEEREMEMGAKAVNKLFKVHERAT